MNENDRRPATELSLPVPSYYRLLIDLSIYFSNQKQPFHEVHQSFTKARDRQIVVSAWQRPGGIPALAVIPLKCDFILPSIIFNQSYSMISLHFFRNRSRLEMVREGPVGFSLALCSFLLDKSWRQIGPRMSTTRSVPVWIHSSKAAGIKGTFPGTNVRWCQMFFSCYNFDLLVLSQKTPWATSWFERQIRREKALEPQLFPVLAFSHAATRKPDLERAFLSPLRGNKETPLPKKGNESQTRQTCLIKNSKSPWIWTSWNNSAFNHVPWRNPGKYRIQKKIYRGKMQQALQLV